VVSMVADKINALFIKLLPHRLYVQASFLLLWLDPLDIRLRNICAPVFHCYSCPLALFACPIGVIANFSALHIFPFVAVGLLILVAAIVGSLFCGWACPFGLLQDLAARISPPRFNLPDWSSYFRYVVLVAAVVSIPFFFGTDSILFICRFCPAGAIESAIPHIVKQKLSGAEVVRMSPLKTAMLAAFLVSIFFVKRPWCRLLCPLGAILSFFNRLSFLGLAVNRQSCSACGKCHSLCDLAIDPDSSPNHLACIRCLECTKCPTNAISLRLHLDK
jgi:ferredoxin-type protein NapH